MTFTILASDPERRLLGAATASYSLAVGAGVPLVRAGIGAAASQAYTNRALRHRALDALAAGAAVADIIAGLPAHDPGHAQRQLAVIDAAGRSAAHTGADCSDWAGSRATAGPAGTALVVAGNLLPGPAVLEAMTAAFAGAIAERANRPGPADPAAGFALALVRALAAGEAAGGDRRGKQSAALLVAAGGADQADPAALAHDLRVDDHPEPVAELARLLARATAA